MVYRWVLHHVSWLEVVCALALAGVRHGQGYKVNLPLPSDPGFGGGDVDKFQISPDGTQLAYLADQETAGVTELFVVPTDGSRASHKLSPPLGERGLVMFFTFTPDSAHVVFIADAQVDEQFELYSAPVDGSAAALRLHGPMVPGGDVGDTYFTQPLVISGPAQRVVFAADLEQDNQFQLYSAPVDGSTPPIVLNGVLGPEQDVNNGFLLLTPDGSRVLYFSDEEIYGAFHLWSVPVGGTASPTKVIPSLPGGQGVGGEGGTPVQLTANGTELVYRGDPRISGVFELFRVPSDGSAPPVPVSDPLPAFADVLEFGLTPDGLRVIFRADAGSDQVFELWSATIHGGTASVKLSGSMVPGGDVDGTGTLDGPFQISPDGARVVYRADQMANGRFELFSAPVDGGASAVRLNPALPSGRNTTAYRISPDAQRVVYLANPHVSARDELFVVSIEGGGAERLSGPLVAGGKVQRDFRVGGEHVVFRVDARVDEQFELFSSPLAGLPPPVKSADGIPRASGPTLLSVPLAPASDVETKFLLTDDGSHVVCLADMATPNAKEVFRVSVDASEEPMLISGVLTAGPPVGDVDRFGFAGRRMVYSANQDLPQVGELFSVSLDDFPSRVKLHDHALSGGSVMHARPTPNGTHVVYLADPHLLQQYELFSVPADGSTLPIELSGTIVPAGGNVFEEFHFTPDGSRVVYLGNLADVNVNELYSAPVDGSAPQVRLNAPLFGQRDVETDIALSPDSQWVLYRADQDTLDRIELYSVPSDGSAPPVKLNLPMIAEGDVVGSPFTPENRVLVTPDSSHVVFGADQTLDDVFEVFVAPIDGSAPALRLSPPLAGNRDASPAAVTPQGGHVLYRTDELVDGRFDLYCVPIDGSQPPIHLSDSLGSSGVGACKVSLDGSRAVYVARKLNEFYGLFSSRIDGSQAQIEIGEVMTAGHRIESFLLLPDGQRAVYQILGSALFTAWIDGSHPAVRLDQFQFATDLTLVANDELVYLARALLSGSTELFRVPLLGDRPAQRLHDPLPIGRDVTGFAIDSSGTRVLYRTDQEADERYELFLAFLSPPYRRAP